MECLKIIANLAGAAWEMPAAALVYSFVLTAVFYGPVVTSRLVGGLSDTTAAHAV